MPDYWYRNEETGEERLFTVPDPPRQRLETATLPAPVYLHMESRGDFAAQLRKARETEQRRVWWLVSEEETRREDGE